MAEQNIVSFPLQSEFLGYDDTGNPLYDRAISVKDLQYIYKMWFTNGIYYDAGVSESAPGYDLQVTANGGMQIRVNPGRIHIEGVICFTHEEILLDVPMSGVNSRKDLVVVRLDRELNRICDVYILPDKSNISNLTRNATIWEMGLARIDVKVGTGTIYQTNIEDLRPYGTKPDDWCGVMAMRVPDPNFSVYLSTIVAQGKELLIEQENWFAQAKADPANYFQRNFDNPSMYTNCTRWRMVYSVNHLLEEIRAGQTESGVVVASRETMVYPDRATVTYKFYDMTDFHLLNHYIEHTERVTASKTKNYVEVVV